MFEKAKLPALTCLCLLSAALQVASEMVAAQKQRILEGRPPAAGAAAAAAPSAAAAVPTPPTETMLPGAEAVETAEPAAAAEGLAAEHEALRAAAAELAAAEEAAVERPAAAAAVVGEELGETAVEEAREANVRLSRGVRKKRFRADCLCSAKHRRRSHSGLMEGYATLTLVNPISCVPAGGGGEGAGSGRSRPPLSL